MIFIYIIILFYIYKKRLSREKKHAYYLSLFLIITTILFFVVSIKNGDIITLSFTILFGIALYNYISQITFEITPHYLIGYGIGNPCTTLYLGEKFGHFYYIQDIYGLTTSYSPMEGKVNFCLSKNQTICT